MDCDGVERNRRAGVVGAHPSRQVDVADRLDVELPGGVPIRKVYRVKRRWAYGAAAPPRRS